MVGWIDSSLDHNEYCEAIGSRWRKTVGGCRTLCVSISGQFAECFKLNMSTFAILLVFPGQFV